MLQAPCICPPVDAGSLTLEGKGDVHLNVDLLSDASPGQKPLVLVADRARAGKGTLRIPAEVTRVRLR